MFTEIRLLMHYFSDKTTLWAAIIFDALPDLKVSPAVPLVASDSQQLLLTKRPSFSLASEDSVPDLHSDEKNTLIRNGSSSGLRMW